MATPQSKETRPLRDDDDYSREFEESISSSGCGGCFSGLLRWRRRRRDGNNEGNGYLLQTEEMKEGWLKKKAKELKEISEILAGPKWKNFIRRFSIYGISKKRRQFQYDIQSYELNFDEGMGKEGDAGFPDFSARFAAPSGIVNKG